MGMKLPRGTLLSQMGMVMTVMVPISHLRRGIFKAMQKQIQSAGKRGFFSKRSVGPQVREKFTFEDMLCFQKDPIPTSLLKINGDLVSRAVKLFDSEAHGS